MLAAIGGLIFAVYLAGYIIFNAIARFQLETRLIGKLYYRLTDDGREPVEGEEGIEYSHVTLDKAVTEFQKRDTIQTEKAFYCGLCCLRRRNFHQDDVNNGRRILQKDLDFSRLLRRNTQMKRAVESMMTPEQIKLNKSDKKLRAVNRDMYSSDSTSSNDEDINTKIEQLKNANMFNCTEVGILKSITQGSLRKDLKKKHKMLLGYGPNPVGTSGQVFSKQVSEVMASTEFRKTKDSLLGETMRNLIDDKSSIGPDVSMNETMTKYADASLLNSSDVRVNFKKSYNDIVMEEPSKEDGKYASQASVRTRSKASHQSPSRSHRSKTFIKQQSSTYSKGSSRMIDICSNRSPISPKGHHSGRRETSGNRMSRDGSLNRSKDGSPIRSSVCGSKKKYDVIYGDADKVGTKGLNSQSKMVQQSDLDVTTNSFKFGNLKRIDSASEDATNPTRVTADPNHTNTILNAQKSDSPSKQAGVLSHNNVLTDFDASEHQHRYHPKTSLNRPPPSAPSGDYSAAFNLQKQRQMQATAL